MHPTLQAFGYGLLWDFSGIVAALVVWPALRERLPETISWGVARLIAPLAVAYVALAPSFFVGVIPFHRGTIAAAVLGLAVVCWALGSRKLPRLKEVAPFEIVYAILLGLACLYIPYIASLEPMGERLRDTSLLNAVWTQNKFPVGEPWLAGYRAQYYMLGYYVGSVLTRFIAPDALAAYNVALSLHWGLHSFSCFARSVARRGNLSSARP
jgi:uncharacterized membrane protein